jgi:hypothetical protein
MRVGSWIVVVIQCFGVDFLVEGCGPRRCGPQRSGPPGGVDLAAYSAYLFLERQPWGNAPRQQEKYIKRGNKVTKRRDLRPAQPAVRQRGGLAKRETTAEKTIGARGGRGATQQQSSTTRKAIEH